MTSTTRTTVYLDRAVAELENALDEQSEAGLETTQEAEALHEALCAAQDVRARLAAAPLLDGDTRLVPAGALVVGDVLVDEAGARRGAVTAVTYRVHAVTVCLADGATVECHRSERMEVTGSE